MNIKHNEKRDDARRTLIHWLVVKADGKREIVKVIRMRRTQMGG